MQSKEKHRERWEGAGGGMVFRVGTGGGGNERRGEGKELLVRVFRGFDVCLVFFFRKESCPGEAKRVLVVFHQNGE